MMDTNAPAPGNQSSAPAQALPLAQQPQMMPQVPPVAPAQAQPPSPFPKAAPAQPPLPVLAQPPVQQLVAPPPYVVSRADSYLTGSEFNADVTKFNRCSHLRTGYGLLDRQQLLHPGLYFIGAVPGLGKTTLCWQMANQIAESGIFILYMSLEQNHFELIGKALSRNFFRANQTDERLKGVPSPLPLYTSIDIRRGLANNDPLLQKHIDAYVKRVEDRVYIVHGAFSLTVEDIEKRIVDLCQEIDKVQPGVKPVVFIDYLQIIAPTRDNRGSAPDTKTSIDHIIHHLKIIQVQYDLVMVVISSLNRANYMSPVDFEALKESGSIEYTADVVWGLQLQLMSDDDFYTKLGANNKPKETSLREKREMIMQAKAASPRKVELSCIKNRYGISSYTVPFDYYPAYDYFCAPNDPSDPDTIDNYFV